MVLGPRHATTFRRFGDRAIVTGFTTVPCPVMPNGDRELAPEENPAPGEGLRTCARPSRRRASPDVAASPARPWPGRYWPWRLTLGLADGLRLRRPDDPRRPGLRGVGARNLGRTPDVQALALGVAARGVAAAGRAEVHVAHVVAGELRGRGAFRAEIPHGVLVVAGQPLVSGTSDGRVPGAAARVPGGADLVTVGHRPPGVHVHITLHAVIGDLDGVLALHPLTDLAGAPRESQCPLGLVGGIALLVVPAVHRGGRDGDGAGTTSR